MRTKTRTLLTLLTLTGVAALLTGCHCFAIDWGNCHGGGWNRCGGGPRYAHCGR